MRDQTRSLGWLTHQTFSNDPGTKIQHWYYRFPWFVIMFFQAIKHIHEWVISVIYRWPEIVLLALRSECLESLLRCPMNI